MSAFLHGITVLLHVHTQTGTDAFNAPVYEDSTVEVENVLVKPRDPTNVSSNTSSERTRMNGKTLAYELAIPKGDTHVWEDTEVEFFGHKFKTTGYSFIGIESMIPLDWNKKVRVELYG